MQIIADISPWITACDQKRHKNEIRTLKIQIKITTDRVRLKVTVCLYPNPSNRARSLSTLIAVSVHKDTPLMLIPAISLMLILAKVQQYGTR